jgi:hypothetical protein
MREGRIPPRRGFDGIMPPAGGFDREEEHAYCPAAPAAANNVKRKGDIGGG